VSPYFIASDYCIDVEMKRAIERHNANEAKVIPVILEHCNWKNLPFGEIQATPTDVKPISQWPNHHEAFNIVIQDIRRAIDALTQLGQDESNDVVTESHEVDDAERSYVEMPRSGNLRVKKDFTDRERSKFLTETIEYIATYFENSMKELEKRNKVLEGEYRRVDANTFTGAIYSSGSLVSECKIWLSVGSGFGEILYSSSRSTDTNSWNKWLNITDDGYILGFNPGGSMSSMYASNKFLSMEGAAEFLWSDLIGPLQ
jgi:hypothetical protein